MMPMRTGVEEGMGRGFRRSDRVRGRLGDRLLDDVEPLSSVASSITIAGSCGECVRRDPARPLRNAFW